MRFAGIVEVSTDNIFRGSFTPGRVLEMKGQVLAVDFDLSLGQQFVHVCFAQRLFVVRNRFEVVQCLGRQSLDRLLAEITLPLDSGRGNGQSSALDVNALGTTIATQYLKS